MEISKVEYLKKYNLTVEDFLKKYGLTKNSLYVAMGYGRHLGGIDNSVRRKYRVNEKFFVDRRNFKERIMKENLDIYYKLHENFSDTQIAKMLEKATGKKYTLWVAWLGQGFWRECSSSILQYKLANNHWLFNKYLRSK